MMKFYINLLLFLGLGVTSICHAQERTKFYNRISSLEVISIGPEFLRGEISETVKSGIRTNFIELGTSPYKHPAWIFGCSWLDFGFSHKFDATQAEEYIMSTYEITTTTTTAGSSTTSTEPLEEIKMSIYRFGFFTECQPFIRKQQKIAPFFRVGFSAERLTSDLPMLEGRNQFDLIDPDLPKTGLGINGKVGVAYNFENEDWGSIRFGYGIGTLPDFDYQLLEGLRIIGGGTYHTVFIAYGFHSYNLYRNNFKGVD